MPLSEEDQSALIGDNDVGVDPTVDPHARMAVMQGSYEDPDVYAEDVRLAKEAGISIDVVRHDKPEAKRQAGLNKMDVKALLGDSPGLVDWLKKTPDNAKVAFDDIPQLAEFERANRERPWFDLSLRDFEGQGENIMLALDKAYYATRLGITAELQEFDTAIINKYRREGNDKLADEMMRIRGDNIKERQVEMKEWLKKVGVADEEIERLTPDDLTMVGQGARSAIQTLADVIPMLGVTYATRGRVNPLMPYIVGKSTATGYGEAMLEGKDHHSALAYGAIGGSIEGVTELLPTKYAEKLFGDLGVDNIKGLIGKFMVGEMAGEQAATFLETVRDVGYDMDKELAKAKTVEEMITIQSKRQAITAISTLFAGSTISGTGYAIQRHSTKDQRKNKALLQAMETRIKSEVANEWLDNQIFMAQSSKTNERTKEAFAEYIETMDPDTRVFINADVAAKIQNLPESIADQLDGTGADLSVPLSTFLSEIVRDDSMLEQLRPHIKVQSEFLTETELKNNYDSDHAKAMIEKAQKHQEAKTEADAIYAQVKDQITATGRQGEATAKFSAELIPSYIVTKQAELALRGIDVSVQDLFDDMGFQVIGPAQAPDLQEPTSVMEQEEDLVPTVSSTQKLGGLTLTDQGVDEAGNTVEVKQKAQQLWNNQQKRIKMVENLRLCVSG